MILRDCFTRIRIWIGSVITILFPDVTPSIVRQKAALA